MAVWVGNNSLSPSGLILSHPLSTVFYFLFSSSFSVEIALVARPRIGQQACVVLYFEILKTQMGNGEKRTGLLSVTGYQVLKKGDYYQRVEENG